MAEFDSKHKFSEFVNQIKRQISGTTIDIKCAPRCAFIFMNNMETQFLETQSIRLLE